MKKESESVPALSGKELVDTLDPYYPRIKTALKHNSLFQLLIATVLSSQTTDSQVNSITPKLFERYPNAESLSNAKLSELQQIIRSTGFFHVKARRIKEISKRLVLDFNGTVPDSMSELQSMKGIGRKTANIVLSAGHGKIEGIAVDTHVFRLSRRIGLSQGKTPERVEEDLMRITPKELWPRLSMLLILHGRKICVAKSPKCSQCVLNRKCLYAQDPVTKDRSISERKVAGKLGIKREKSKNA